MSRRSRALRNARRSLARPVTKVRSPADTLALVPYLFGFAPSESIVVISLQPGGQRFGPIFRFDLPEPEDRPEDRADLADQARRLVLRHEFRRVVVAVFSARPHVADPFVTLVLQGLHAERVAVVDAFRGDGRRWWSYVCEDPWCCPAEGTEYDADASPAAVGAVLAGMAKAPDRASLRTQFEPGDRDAREEIAGAVAALRAAEVAPLTTVQVAELVPRLLAGDVPAPGVRAQLLLSLMGIPQRDAVWGGMTCDNADQHLAAWRELMRLAPDDLLAPVGSLTAFAAWLSGHGVLASHAVERVLEVHPEYAMARLVLRALETSLSPREWTYGTG
jgi:hypothetical protein